VRTRSPSRSLLPVVPGASPAAGPGPASKEPGAPSAERQFVVLGRSAGALQHLRCKAGKRFLTLYSLEGTILAGTPGDGPPPRPDAQVTKMAAATPCSPPLLWVQGRPRLGPPIVKRRAQEFGKKPGFPCRCFRNRFGTCRLGLLRGAVSPPTASRCPNLAVFVKPA